MVSLLDMVEKAEGIVDEVFFRARHWNQTSFGDYNLVDQPLPDDVAGYLSLVQVLPEESEYYVLRNLPKPVITHKRKDQIIVCRHPKANIIFSEFARLRPIHPVKEKLYRLASKFLPNPPEPDDFGLIRKVPFRIFNGNKFYVGSSNMVYKAKNEDWEVKDGFSFLVKSRDELPNIPINEKLQHLSFHNTYLDWVCNELGFQK